MVNNKNKRSASDAGLQDPSGPANRARQEEHGQGALHTLSVVASQAALPFRMGKAAILALKVGDGRAAVWVGTVEKDLILRTAPAVPPAPSAPEAPAAPIRNSMVALISPVARGLPRNCPNNWTSFTLEICKNENGNFAMTLMFVQSGRLITKIIGNPAAPGNWVCVLRGTFPVDMLVPGTLLFRSGV